MSGLYPGTRVSKLAPLGAVLAGGAGARFGGPKVAAELAGMPLVAWPVAALAEAVGQVVVVAKRDSPLPRLGDVAVWLEPNEPAHPLTGLVYALEHAGGRPVLACAADMPLVTPRVARWLASAPDEGSPAVVPRVGGRLQPLLARYEPMALAALRAAPPGQPLTATVEALAPRVVEWEDERPFFNVNSPSDLHAAAQELARGYGN
jgi:molybdenum cofactor guanylyltransferase